MNEPYQIIDTAPLPVCEYVRSRRDRCFKPDADYGYCAAKDMHYYGFKLGLRTSRIGMITHFDLLPARPHDIQLLDDLLDGFQTGRFLIERIRARDLWHFQSRLVRKILAHTVCVFINL